MSKSYDLHLFRGAEEEIIDTDLLLEEATDIINEKLRNKEADLQNDVFILREFDNSDPGNINKVICFGEVNNILFWTHA